MIHLPPGQPTPKIFFVFASLLGIVLMAIVCEVMYFLVMFGKMQGVFR